MSTSCHWPISIPVPQDSSGAEVAGPCRDKGQASGIMRDPKSKALGSSLVLLLTRCKTLGKIP
jgi:hypothetical protein